MISLAWRRCITVLVLAAAFMPPAALAQTTSASIRGSVRTARGTPVVDAVVYARSERTGAARSVTTGPDGAYRFDLIEPGIWKVWAQIPEGPAAAPRTVNVGLQQTIIQDFTVGPALQENVVVTSEAPLVDRNRIGSELRIDSEQVATLPVNGRSVTDLALLDASVLSPAPGGFYGERAAVFVVSGQSGRANSFLVDGLDNNDRVSGTTLNAGLSQQVIREFVVLTRQYAAEFGRAGGGILNVITERGTNDASGEIFAQGVSPSVDPAGSFVNDLPDPGGVDDASGRFQTGFKMGGPLKKDRAFWFVAFEHQESDDVTPYTGIDRTGSAGGWTLAPNRDDNLFLRTDVNLNDRHTLMARLIADDRRTSDLNVVGRVTPEAGFRVDEGDIQIAGSLSSVITPALFNEVRFLAGGSEFDQTANSDRPGVDRPGGVFGSNNLSRQNRDETILQIVENLTWRAGTHTPKAGIDLTRSRTRIRTRFSPRGNFLYDTDLPFEPGDCGDLLASQVDPNDRFAPIDCPGDPGVDDDGDGLTDEPGVIGTYPFVYTLVLGRPEATLDDTRIGVFAQDTWQATPALLLDYGLRWDVSTYRLPTDARVPSRIDNGGAGRDVNDVAPRFGFSWAPGDSGRTVIRGGAGVFHDKLVLGFPAVAAITSGTEIGLLFPQGFTFEINEDVVEQVGVGELRQLLVFPQELVLRFSTGTRLDTPYSVQYSLGWERAVGARGAISANVSRVLGYHLPLFRDLNPVVDPDPNRVSIPEHRDDTTGSIAALVTEGRSWYTGLDLGWRWRGPEGWYGFSYTWSKAIDLGPDPLKGGVYIPPNSFRNGLPLLPNSDDLSRERGRSDSDRRHRFVLFGGTPLEFLGLRLSGIVQAASGAPFNVTTGRDENVDGITSDRPEGVARNTGERTDLREINALRRLPEFNLPPVRHLDEPWFFQTDLRLSRPFLARRGRAGGELFVQVLNLTNRFNGGPIDGTATSRTFGEPVGLAGPPRTIEFGVKVGFDAGAGQASPDGAVPPS